MFRLMIAAVAMLASFSAFAEGYSATAKLSDGKTLLLLEHSKDCGGKQGASLLDKGMMNVGQTCDVSSTDQTVTARFGIHEISMPVGSFAVMSYPTIPTPRD